MEDEEYISMKIKIFSAVGLLFLLAGVLLLFWFFRETDEKKIHRTLDELCRIGSKSSGENPALGALKANRAEKVFAPRCRFDFKYNSFDGEYNPTEIGSKILQIQSFFQWIKLETSDIEISVNENNGKIFFTGEFSGLTKNGKQEKISEIRDIEAELVKNDKDEWKFVRMNIRPVLEK